MRTLTTIAVLLTAATISADVSGDCSFTEKRNVAAPTAGVSRFVIIGRAGYLHINGRGGSSEVRASGTACASSREVLAATKLTLSRSGSEIRIEAETPDGGGLSSSARLDFDVTVPDNIPLRVDDGSGDLTIDTVATVDLADGSGDIDIRNVTGDLSVRDGSGDMKIDNVSGDVHITDGSGDIDVNRAGSVEIANDGSGGVDIRNVKHDVHIGNKGSGSVKVSDVGGNFRVGKKGGGSIDWARAAGHVDVPERLRK
jgi:Putative adhesin